MRLEKTVTVISLAVLMSFVTIAPASARIVCKNGLQRSSGQWIATPYCQDALLAKVARTYGTRVSAKSIRNNPNKKRNLCHFIGSDTRISHICAPYMPRGGRVGP